MSFGNDGGGGDASYALSPIEQKSLAETRIFTKKCENKIEEKITNFADKSAFGLWWDAKGLFNSSDVVHVTDHMERYKNFYKKIDLLSAKVQKGDPESFERFDALYKDLEEMERDALRDVENNQSTAICQMLREFLDKKYILDHNLKKVECIVMYKKVSDVDKFIEENRAAHRKSGENLKQILEEAEEKYEARIREMRKQNEELRLEADKRSRESEEKLKLVLMEAEERSEARLRKMKEESDKYRLEAEKVRQESDEKLKQAVEEANRRSEARMQDMADQNRANLQKMTKMLESMNLS